MAAVVNKTQHVKSNGSGTNSTNANTNTDNYDNHREHSTSPLQNDDDATRHVDITINSPTTASRTTTMTLKRKAYTHFGVEAAYPVRIDDDDGDDVLNTGTCGKVKDGVGDYCGWNNKGITEIFLGYVPIVGMLRNYKWRKDIFIDIMAGISVSFLQLPQGLALGLLAGLPPVYGLYTTFYSVLIYMLFGTSRHTSIGTNAVISILTATTIERQMALRSQVPHLALSSTTGTSPSTQLSTLTSGATQPMGSIPYQAVMTSSNTPTSVASSVMDGIDSDLEFKVGVTACLALISGVYLTVAGIFKLGFLTTYLSSSFVGGFTTATSVHIFTSQVNKLFHVPIASHSGIGKIVKTYADIATNIGSANPADVVVSLISIIFLLVITICVNERYKEKLMVPIPSQLILVCIATIVSHFAQLGENFGVAVIGHIPTGLPSPIVPQAHDMGSIAIDAISVAVLTFTISISLAKLMARNHDYKIDTDQEFVAYGLSGIFSSFFGCIAPCNAPPRVMILSSVGARTLVHSLSCSAFILVVLLAAGPLFGSLPVAVLAAMICVAMKNLLLQVTQLPYYWRTSKPDFMVWILTCLASIFLDLDYGIVTGLAVSMVMLLCNSQRAKGTVGGVSASEDFIHLNSERRNGLESREPFISNGQFNTSCSNNNNRDETNNDKNSNRKNNNNADHFNNFAIFYFPSSIHFANAEKFKQQLFSKILDPEEMLMEKESNGEWSIVDDSNSNRAAKTESTTKTRTDITRDKKESRLEMEMNQFIESDSSSSSSFTSSKLNVNQSSSSIGASNINTYTQNNTPTNNNEYSLSIEQSGMIPLKTQSADNNDINSKNKLNNRLKFVILNCSAMTYADLDGVNMVKRVTVFYRKVGVKLLLSNCCHYLLNLLEKVDYFKTCPKEFVFYDTYDAIHYIKCLD